jgi:hypothetical protein
MRVDAFNVVPVRREIRVPVPGAQSQRCGAVWYTGDSFTGIAHGYSLRATSMQRVAVDWGSECAIRGNVNKNLPLFLCLLTRN